MTVALPAQRGGAPEAAEEIVRVEIFAGMAEAESLWRQIEADPGNLMSPYQKFDFLASWQRHVGIGKGLTPLIAVGLDRQNAPLCLWPLGRRAVGPLHLAEFLGGKHSNFNAMIWNKAYAQRATAESLDIILSKLAESVDALILLNQPRHWDNVVNPLARLANSPSADSAFSGTLMPEFEALLQARMSANKRKKLRNRERALAQHGEVRFWRARSPDDALDILATFHEQKAQRMRELGVANVFEEPGVRDFIAEAATANVGYAPAIEVYALSVGGQIIATSAGSVAGQRFSTMFNSIIRTELAQTSPGQLLLNRLVQNACERGLQTFDLGVGDAQYKETFCGDQEPLFDSFLPLSTGGRMLSSAIRAAYAAKRTIKRNEALWSAVQMARRVRARMAGNSV